MPISHSHTPVRTELLRSTDGQLWEVLEYANPRYSRKPFVRVRIPVGSRTRRDSDEAAELSVAASTLLTPYQIMSILLMIYLTSRRLRMCLLR